MPGNNDPIFSRVGDVTSDGSAGMGAYITAAAADYTGVSANYSQVFQADSVNGSFLQRLRFKANGTNVATVARIFINNGSANTTAANNTFYGEVSLVATTASATAGTPDIDYPMMVALPPGFKVIVGLGTAVAGGWKVTAVGGKY